jgi:hypothetical protein
LRLEGKMPPTTVIYWTRFGLGVAAALLSTFIGILTGDRTLLNGVTVALLIYIVTYYIYKALFGAKVEKPSKIFTTGVGAYFLSWIALFALFSTLAGPTTIIITSPTPNGVFSIGDTVTIEAKIASPFGSLFSGAIVTAANTTDVVPARSIQLIETPPGSGSYSATYKITTSDPAGSWNIIVGAEAQERELESSVNVVIQNAS